MGRLGLRNQCARRPTVLRPTVGTVDRLTTKFVQHLALAGHHLGKAAFEGVLLGLDARQTSALVFLDVIQLGFDVAQPRLNASKAAALLLRL